MPTINNKKLSDEKTIRGYLKQYDGQSFYCIENYDEMPAFLISIVSSGDLWMYISSKGGLTAGRQNYNNALFPYETDDKLHDAHLHSGPFSIIKEINKDITEIWQPFGYNHQSNIKRRLLKSSSGTSIVFEEMNHSLGLKFTYSWSSCETLGWVRKVKIENLSKKSRKLSICDGIRNILPWGIQRETQSMMSTLMDAYKQAQWEEKKSFALFYLSSIPVDRAEPAEALRTQTAWYSGLYKPIVSLSNDAPNEFIKNGHIQSAHNITGKRTSFTLQFSIDLKPTESAIWYQVIDTAKDYYDLEVLENILANETDHASFIEKCINQNIKDLENLVKLSDGIQTSPDNINDQRHFNNTLFNIMRGGIFRDVYQINTADFILHIKESNYFIFEKHQHFFKSLKNTIDIDSLLNKVNLLNDNILSRLSVGYLPLSFGRRHGDPSRPWNFFDIKVKNDDGSPIMNYQGNWRDIFQNWEALGYSFPKFVKGMITRFLNATTADGYNPYRITRNSYEWEVPEPDNPWAYIGYWGDHQIIYLHRLLLIQQKFFQGSLLNLLEQQIYAYARVPYIIKNYDEMLENPRDTVVFDKNLHEELLKNNKIYGADGLLMSLPDKVKEQIDQSKNAGLSSQPEKNYIQNHNVYQVNMLEKLLVTMLTKFSNFIPDAGLWLNTQRPEWNDANNALVGYGASVVSLCQLRSFVKFLHSLFIQTPEEKTFIISSEVYDFYKDIYNIYLSSQLKPNAKTALLNRKNVSEKLGRTAEKYRKKAYIGFSGKKSKIKVSECMKLFKLSLSHFDESIKSNKREDGLFHAYNLIEWDSKQIRIHRLPLMLEGQVAVLGCEILDEKETYTLLHNLFKSSLYRKDQESFMLYPDKSPGSFYNRNIIDLRSAKKSPLLQKLLEQNNHEIIRKTPGGKLCFNSCLLNSRLLQEKLNIVCQKTGYKLSPEEEANILSIYESVFNHRFFTGRSGSFFKYEGLGSIYWHQVSKLLIAVGENAIRFSSDNNASCISELNKYNSEGIKKIKEFYYQVKKGIGAHKQPNEYGAIPTDPYSHTPAGMGAQQPGMTGQVKEDFLSRFLELGLHIEAGKIYFNPVLFNSFEHPEDCIHFSFCGCSIILKQNQQTSTPRLIITFNPKNKQLIKLISKDVLSNKESFIKEESITIHGLIIPEIISERIFSRDNSIIKVEVFY
ncbi:MAG: hypothetical protein KGZ97_11525 [Bacteroidetes bacterium]|nr:hypothetical protein [Bacteroidota bacterium]